MSKITQKEYAVFHGCFNMFPSTYRFGQAFIVQFHMELKDMLPDPEVFYEKDYEKADALIRERYIIQE